MSRPKNPMPDSVQKALQENDLSGRYEERPWYQRNDYLGWIIRAKRPETKAKRLAIMLQELRAGDAYMNMAWRPRQTKSRSDNPTD
ncbi:YdeI/OmpD-associated family protein [Cognatishimia sp. WU-CL00825]|uniref:YdeI/OmpD-associated family protein n=1 Tax=Cognatishimia sp. WU-CL00825 TaxID=3127658 RepID=UPI0031069797